jgi:DNA-binding CsgD family transcriptional regulator/PAS domain-containing protein
VADANALNRLLATLYAAPARPEMWNVFLKELGLLTGVNKAALISHDFTGKDHRILATLGDSVKDTENVRLYENFYSQVDEWSSRFPKGEDGRVVLGEQIWPQEAMLRSTFYNEFLKKVDISRMACVAINGPPGVFEALSIYRELREDEFDCEQLATLQQLVPHLQTTLYTRRKLLELESRVLDMETALDALSTALVMVDASAKVLFANRNARAILACRDGLLSDGGRLIAQHCTDRTTLRAALATATNIGTGKAAPKPQAALISRATQRPLQIVAVPCRPGLLATPKKAAAIVLITDPDQKPPTQPELLRTLFRLTQAEIKLAVALRNGTSLSEAANLNCIGRETVRSQLKSIFVKTGTRRQSELIGLLVKLPEINMGTE